MTRAGNGGTKQPMKEFIAECKCGHRKTLPPDIGPEIKHVLHLVERLICSKCQQIVHRILLMMAK